MLALQDITILDLTRQGPGPFCTMILGDLGAEVTKIEVPPTAGARQAGLFQSPVGEAKRREAVFDAHNRNKKSLAINLRSQEGRRIFSQLAEKADVIVESFRPGVVKRLGIDYESMAKINPRIIYCSISAYGQDGPYRDIPAHDVNCISIAGAIDLIGERSKKPVIPHNLVADYGGGAMSAAVGILSAVIARQKMGRGQHVDISLTDSVVQFLSFDAAVYFQHGIVLSRGEHAPGGAYPYYNVYETADGKYVTIGCMEPWLWENLCRALGREDLIEFHFEPDHRLHRAEGREWEKASCSLRELFLTKTRDEWFDLLRQKDIPIAKVNSINEVFADAQMLHRNMVVEVEHPKEGKVKQVGIAIKLSETPGKIRNLGPVLGEQTKEILVSLGYDETKIEELYQSGVIG